MEKGQKNLVHEFTEKTGTKHLFTKKMFGVWVVVLLLGVGSGFILTRVQSSQVQVEAPQSEEEVEVGQTYGSTDTETFKDTAEGEMAEGGIDGEGQFHLKRPGGESQNVYLISSVVDLSQFVGREVKVWGSTQKAQVAGWLMDVGRVEVLE